MNTNSHYFVVFLLLFLISASGVLLPQTAKAVGTAIAKPSNNLGLVGYWPMNEGTTTKSSDFSGNGNTGTFTGSSPPTSTSGWTNGKRGGALGFDGTNDCLDVGDINATEGQTKLTISVWLYDRSPGTGKGIVSKYTGAAGNWALFTSDAGAGGSNDMEFDPDGAEAVYTTTNAHKANRWEHWVVVYDGTQGTDLGKIDLYLNGVVQAETLTSSPIGSVTGSNTNTVCIGSDSDTTAGINGIIDEVRIYNRALSVSEVRALYGNNTSGAVRANASSKTLTNGTTLTRGLVGLWSFDGSDTRWTSATTGTTADGSGRGGTGTLTSMSMSTTPAIGKLGQAFNFDGSASRVVVTTGGAVSFSSSFTLSAWINPNTASLSGTHSVFATGFGTGLYLELSGDEPSCGFAGGASHITPSANLVPNTWYNITCTFDDANNLVDIYVNGTQRLEEAESASHTTSSNVILGSTDTPSQVFSGKMDEMRVYNRVLSPAEVKALSLLGAVKIRP